MRQPCFFLPITGQLYFDLMFLKAILIQIIGHAHQIFLGRVIAVRFLKRANHAIIKIAGDLQKNLAICIGRRNAKLAGCIGGIIPVIGTVG